MNGTWCHDPAGCITITYPTIQSPSGSLTLVPAGLGGTFDGCFDFDVPHAGPGGSPYASYCPADAPTVYDPFLKEHHETGIERLMYGASGEGFFYYRGE